MKRFIALVLALAMLVPFALAGCSKSDGGSGSSSSGGASSGGSSSSGSSSSGSGGAAAPQETIKFGGVWGITGSTKATGDYCREATALAIEAINEAGGVLGRMFELIEEDEMDTQQTSVNAVQKLLSRGDIVAFFQGTTSTNAIAVSPIVREAEVIHMAGGSSANVWKQENPWVWQVRMTDENTGQLFARAAAVNLGMKKPAILHITDSFGQGLADGIVEALGQYDVEIAGVFSFPEKEMQFAPIVSQVMASGCDGLIAISHDEYSPLIMKEMVAMGKGIPCIGSSSYSSAVTLELAGEAAMDWYVCSDWDVTVDSPETKAFVEKYVARYGREPTFMGVVAHDSIMLVAEAIKIAGTTDIPAVNEALAQIKDYKGVMATQTANANRSFNTVQYLVQNIKRPDGSIIGEVVDTVSRP